MKKSIGMLLIVSLISSFPKKHDHFTTIAISCDVYIITDHTHRSLNIKNTIKMLDNPPTSLQILIDLGFDLQERLKLNLETEIDEVNSNKNIHVDSSLKNQAVAAINAVNNTSIQKIIPTLPPSSLSKFAIPIEQWVESGKSKPLKLKQALSKEL